MRQCPPPLPCKTSMQDRAGPRIEVKRKRLHQTMSCIEAKLIVLYRKEETKERKQPEKSTADRPCENPAPQARQLKTILCKAVLMLS